MTSTEIISYKHAVYFGHILQILNLQKKKYREYLRLKIGQSKSV